MQLPLLREELQLQDGARDRDGSPTWVIYDPPSNRFFQIGWLEFEFLSNWHLGDSDALLNSIQSESTLNPSHDDLQRFLVFLQQNFLIRDTSPQGTSYLRTRAQHQKKTISSWLMHNYLFFRVPLLQPDAFLAKLYKIMRTYIPQNSYWGILIAGFVGLYLMMRQWDLFRETFVNTLTPAGLLGYIIMLMLAKSIHELGHALVAKHYGLRVPRMGVAFLVMFPVLYTDTGETWFLSDHKKRLLISASGILAESALALIALFLWGISAPGTLRDLFYFLAVVSLVRTLLINSSPFLRFDGYYILSDILDLPNMQQRAFALAQNQMRRVLLGINMPDQESFSKRMRTFLILYSWATWIYRLIVFTGIALAVYHYFFKALGVVAFIIEIYYFILMPVFREIKIWIEASGMISPQRKKLFFIVGSFVLLVFLAPLQATISAPAYIGAYERWHIFSPYSAKIIKSTPNGTQVKKGDILFVLDAHEQRHQASIAALQASELRERTRRLSVASDYGKERASNWLAEAREKEQVSLSQQSELKRLVMRAESDGVLLDVDEGIKAGVYVTPRDILGLLVNPHKSIIDAFVTEHDLKRIKVGSACTFRSSTQSATQYRGKVISIGRNRLSSLPNHFLADKSGGDIATVNSQDQHLVPSLSMYRVRIEPVEAVSLSKIYVGNVSIAGKRESIAGRFLNQALSVVVRESGL